MYVSVFRFLSVLEHVSLGAQSLIPVKIVLMELREGSFPMGNGKLDKSLFPQHPQLCQFVSEWNIIGNLKKTTRILDQMCPFS